MKKNTPAAETPTGLPALQQRIEVLRQEQEERQLEMPFPNWPNDRRAAPNLAIRSALFGVIRRGRRTDVKKLDLPASTGFRLLYSGTRLDQSDLDVWLQIMHLARDTKPGSEIRMSLRHLLRELGRSTGKSDYTWLKRRIEDLYRAEFTFRQETTGREIGAGTLIQFYDFDPVTSELIITTNQKLRRLFEDITYLRMADRLALGGHQLAKWLHAVVESHAQWMPTRVERIMHDCGSDFKQLRDFRGHLRAALELLRKHGIIHTWRIDSFDCVHITRQRTPSQRRHLERRASAVVWPRDNGRASGSSYAESAT